MIHTARCNISLYLNVVLLDTLLLMMTTTGTDSLALDSKYDRRASRTIPFSFNIRFYSTLVSKSGGHSS